MSGLLTIWILMGPVLLVVGLSAVLGGVLLGAMGRSSRPEDTPVATLIAARRHATWATAIALGLGALALAGTLAIDLLGVAWFPIPGTPPGLAFGLVFLVAGLVYVLTLWAGEVTWPRPEGSLRTAALVRRTVADVAPRVPWLALVVWSTLLEASVVVFGLLADGTRFTVVYDPPLPDGTFEVSAGPFPGWPYGLPILVLSLLLVLATLVVLRQVARRPAVAGVAPEADLDLRRTSAARLLKGAQLAVGATLAGVLAFAGQAIAHTRGPAAGVPIVVLGVLVLLAALVAVAVPTARSTRRAEPAPATGAGPWSAPSPESRIGLP